MRSYPHHELENLSIGLNDKLHSYREWRNFDAQSYIEKKCRKLNEYYEDAGMDSAVIAVSGGIDSCLVLLLIYEASRMKNSPIKHIYPILLPSGKGMTNKDESVNRGLILCNQLKLKPIIFDISPIVSTIDAGLSKATELSGDSWAVGQLAAYGRTPVLYYMTSLLTANNMSGLIIGTANLDECGYLGYIGKASDGMTDIQLISDIHKSEVFAVAKELNAPREIIEVAPNGDMYDGRKDIEVFGAPYDFVELYFYWLTLDQKDQVIWVDDLDSESQTVFSRMSENLEILRRHNAHKYKTGSPAFHLDLDDLIYFKKSKYGWGMDVE